VTETNSYLPTR